MLKHADNGSQAGRLEADPLRGRRLFLGGLAAGIVTMSAVGLATAAFIQSPQGLAARSAPPPGSALTATVRSEVLTNVITTRGTVRSARTISVTARAPFATVTITRLPVRVGQRVHPGRVIAEVDGRPILLLRGRLPAYRNLHEGDHGPDVLQLQRDLEHLGYADYDPAGYFEQSTALALLLLYRSLGYDAPLYHPRAKMPDPGLGRRPTDAPIPSACLPMSEVAFVPSPSALVVTVSARVGRAVPSGPIMTLATGNPYVTGFLSEHQASLARPGMPAQIVSAAPRLVAAGTVTRIGSLPVVGGPPASGLPVQVRTRRPLPKRMIGSRVRLTLEAPVTSGPVLAVPLSAIYAARRGTSAYVVKIAAGGLAQRIAVLTGPSADGLVAVQAAHQGRLRPGDRVLIGLRR